MAKLPWQKFYPADWMSDPALSMCSAATRGIWIDLICAMYSTGSGTMRGTAVQISRIARCTPAEITGAMDELSSTGAAEVAINNTDVTPMFEITSRRIQREIGIREGNAERQRRIRENGGGNPDRWAAIRYEILQRDAKTCAYCGRRADTVDHIIPKSRGGDESPENLVACCKRCNMQKGNKAPDEAGMTFWNPSHRCNTDSNTDVTPEKSEVRYQSISNTDVLDMRNASPDGDAGAPKIPTKARREVKRFTPPSIEELTEYGNEIGLTPQTCQRICEHYTSNGWRVGKNPMKDWKATMRGWKLRDQEYRNNGTNQHNTGKRNYCPDAASNDRLKDVLGA